MRPHPGKLRAVVLDHSGAAGVHGLPGDDIEWSLDGDSTVDSRRKDAIESGQLAKPIVCLNCGLVYSATPACPSCGFAPRSKEKPRAAAKALHEARDEVLTRYEGTGKTDQSAEKRQRHWTSLMFLTASTNRTLGAAAAMFSKKWGIAPWKAGVSPIPNGQGDWQQKTADVFPQFQRKKEQVAC